MPEDGGLNFSGKTEGVVTLILLIVAPITYWCGPRPILSGPSELYRLRAFRCAERNAS